MSKLDISVDSEKLLALRQKRGMNQTEFWLAVGVTQSGGSRYESGRSIPAPVVAEVIRVHIKGEPAVTELLKKNKKALS